MDTVQPYPVTGYSLCNALGHSTDEVMEALDAGRTGLAPPRAFELPFVTCCGELGGELPPPPAVLAPYDTRLMRITMLALDGMHAEVTAAVERWGGDRVAVVMGTSTGGIDQTEAAHRYFQREGRIREVYDFERHHPFHLSATVLAELFGIRGPQYVISTACSSGGKTLAASRRLLDAGVVDAVVTGAVDSLCQTTLRGFHSLSILSPEPCQPFGKNRQGISIGEGAGVLLLERRGEAATELLAVGESSDAYHMSSPDPEGRGATASMGAALSAAGLEPSDVDYINCHGTGTMLNDSTEAKAMYALFGDEVPVAATKGYTGHLLGAGGTVEAIFAIMSLEQGWIPASVGAEPLDDDILIDILPTRRTQECRRALSNSFGFGGSNVSVLLGARP